MISVVIVNYNNEKYIRCCIESVLPYRDYGVEIVVVDDGSSDNSREILSGYENDVKIVLKTNGGQMSVYATGLRESSRDWILFLDGDDCLSEASFSEVFDHLEVGVSKIQYNLGVIDASGIFRGGKIPTMKMGAIDERESLSTWGEYASPPASGAIYSRIYLAQILPILEKTFRLPVYADAPLYLLAPYFGRIVSINKVCALYRKHSAGACGWSDSLEPVNLRFNVRKQYFSEKRAIGVRNRVCRDVASQFGVELKIGKPRTLNELKVVAFLAGTVSIRGLRSVLFSMIRSSVLCPGYPFGIRVKSIAWSILYSFPFGQAYRTSLGAKLFR